MKSRLFMLLCLLISAQGYGTTPGNAAVKYLRADVALRQAYVLGPDAISKLEKALQSPLDEADEKLVAAATDALNEFQNASTMATCDWELSANVGPSANTSHRGAIRELVAISGIRARLRFRDGQVLGAVQDWLSAVTAARHLSTDGTITSVLISYTLEHELSPVLASQLGRLAPSELEALERGIEALPPDSTMKSAVAAEKLSRNDLSDAVAHATTRDDAVRSLAGLPILQGNKSKAEEIVDGCDGSVDGVRACIRKQSDFYAEWDSRWSEPPAQFETDYNDAFSSASHDNPIINDFTPSLPRLRWAEASCQTRRMLLRAAIAVQRHGRSILSRFPDPSDGKQFTFSLRDGGFQLESQTKEDGTPLAITVKKEALLRDSASSPGKN